MHGHPACSRYLASSVLFFVLDESHGDFRSHAPWSAKIFLTRELIPVGDIPLSEHGLRRIAGCPFLGRFAEHFLRSETSERKGSYSGSVSGWSADKRNPWARHTVPLALMGGLRSASGIQKLFRGRALGLPPPPSLRYITSQPDRFAHLCGCACRPIRNRLKPECAVL